MSGVTGCWDVKRGASTPLNWVCLVHKSQEARNKANMHKTSTSDWKVLRFSDFASHAESSYYIHMVPSFRTKITHGWTFRGQLGRSWIRSAIRENLCNLSYDSTSEYYWSKKGSHDAITNVRITRQICLLVPGPLSAWDKTSLWLWDLRYLVLKCWWLWKILYC